MPPTQQSTVPLSKTLPRIYQRIIWCSRRPHVSVGPAASGRQGRSSTRCSCWRAHGRSTAADQCSADERQGISRRAAIAPIGEVGIRPLREIRRTACVPAIGHPLVDCGIAGSRRLLSGKVRGHHNRLGRVFAERARRHDAQHSGRCGTRNAVSIRELQTAVTEHCGRCDRNCNREQLPLPRKVLKVSDINCNAGLASEGDFRLLC